MPAAAPRPSNPILARWEAVRSGRAGDAAVIFPDGSVARTFAAIEAAADEWAQHLAGVQGAVAIQLGNAPEWPEVLLGAWRAGRTVVPMDADLEGERRTRVEVLCGVGTRVERVEGKISLTSCGGRAAVPPGGGGGDLFKLTSGTTGAPRAIRFDAGQLMADCENVCDTMGLRERDRNFGAISFAHSYGFSNLITPLLCRGIPLVAVTDVLPWAMRDALSASEASVFPGVPAFFRALANWGRPGGALRLCISAGAPLDAALAGRLWDAWGMKIHSFYGASECGGICYDRDDAPAAVDGFVGQPMDRVTVRPLSAETPFSISVSSAAVGSGYLPEEAGELATGTYFPGDLLEFRDGGYIVTGRRADLINVAGRKVNPLEIEHVLLECPGVVEAVAFGLSERMRGQEVAACVVAPGLAESALRAHCHPRLAAWQVPRRWIFVEEIPRTARGKISRAALRQRYEGGTA